MMATTVWTSVSKWLPPRDEHSDYWWGLAGPHLAVLLHHSGYSLSSQYETLLFFYHHISPRLGLAPSSFRGGATGPCGHVSRGDGSGQRLTVERGPDYMASRTERIEYSWRWPQGEPGSDKPEIRLGVKPWSRLAGTVADPLNLLAATDLLTSLAPQIPSLDLTLFHYFRCKLYDQAQLHRYVGAKECQGLPWVCFTGFEFRGNSILPKAYFYPCKLGHVGMSMPLAFWEDALTGTSTHLGSSLDNVLSFIKTAAPKLNLDLTLRWIGVDLVDPAHARLKLYCTDTHPSFESVVSVLTMGGQIDTEPAVLDQIWELLAGMCGLPVGFPRDEPLPCLPSIQGVSGDNSGVFLYYFDVGPGSSRPQKEKPGIDVKLYFPAWSYASDAQIAAGLAAWMGKQGRGQFVEAYGDALRHIISHRALDDVGPVGPYCAAQMMISIMVRRSKLQVTSYISPEGHHPGRRTW